MNRNVVNFCVLVALSVLGVPNVGYTQELTGFANAQRVVKLNKTAGTGKCLPKPNKSLKDLGVTAYEAKNTRHKASIKNKLSSSSDPRIKSLTTVLSAISNASNGKLDGAIKGTKFFYGDSSSGSTSRQTAQGIQLNGVPNSDNQNVRGGGSKKYGGTDNFALIAHEFGHKIGNSRSGRAGNIYNAYRKKMKGLSCTISHYGHTHNHKPNEHFADAFAAYVTNPGLFKNKGSGCSKSFDFFKDLFGEPNLKARCDSRLKSIKAGKGISFGKGGVDSALKGDSASLGGGLFGGVGVILDRIKKRREARKKAQKERAKALAAEQDRNNALIRSNGGSVNEER